MKVRNFFSELKRRDVYKVAAAYVVASWLLIQAASILLPTFDAPAWIMKVLIVLLALGFILAVIVAWIFEITPYGIQRTAAVSPEEADVVRQLEARAQQEFVRGFLCALSYARVKHNAKELDALKSHYFTENKTDTIANPVGDMLNSLAGNLPFETVPIEAPEITQVTSPLEN